MATSEKLPPASDVVRRLARQGHLAGHLRSVSDAERRRLRAGAGEIVWPLVFQRVTKPVERRRGHHLCATAVQRLEPDCLDRFHDDVDAVLDDLFAHADVPVNNLEGWLTSRMRRATVDAYRRRRGQRGAPQRPRVPAWLAMELGGDAWLTELAKSILDWVGVEATAGTALWPLSAWAERRATVTGDHTASEAVVNAEIECVLVAMRRRNTWYERNVEQPLGRKQAPVWLPSRTGTGDVTEPEPLVLVAPYERDDALLREVAAQAISLLTERLGRGEEPEEVVPEVVRLVLRAVPASYRLDRVPGAGPDEPDQAIDLISDPAVIARIVATVLDLVQGAGHR